MTTTTRHLHIAGTPDRTIGSIYREHMDLAAVSIVDGRRLDGEFHHGVAQGVLFALGLDVRGVATYRGDANGRAIDAATALERYHSLDMARRRQVSRASGVLRGWALGTEDRADAEECSDCGARLCVDIEDHERCAAGHGFFCSSECRQDWCGRACHEAGVDL